jgi:hypothetical protein
MLIRRDYALQLLAAGQLTAAEALLATVAPGPELHAASLEEARRRLVERDSGQLELCCGQGCSRCVRTAA